MTTAANQTSPPSQAIQKKIRMCGCFFSKWERFKRKSADVLRDLFDEVFHNRHVEVQMFLGNIKNVIRERIRDFSPFQVLDEKIHEIIHICDQCFEKVLLSKNLRLVPDWQYFNALNSLDFFNSLDPDRLDLDGPMGLALLNACVAAVIQKQKEISKICPNCQNFILNRLFLGDFLLLNFNF